MKANERLKIGRQRVILLQPVFYFIDMSSLSFHLGLR